MVEGHLPRDRQSLGTLFADFYDSFHGCAGILQNGIRRYSQSRDLLGTQEFRSPSVPARRDHAIVRSSIYLDRETKRRAIEIENVDSSRMLATEFEAAGPFAQFAPQQALWQTHLAAEFSSKVESVSRSGYHLL